MAIVNRFVSPNGIKGVVESLTPCPVCGGHPRVHVYMFDAHKKGIHRMVNGRSFTIAKEKRVYFDCQCGCKVIGWQEPTYNRDGCILVDAMTHAKDAWERGEFLAYKFTK